MARPMGEASSPSRSASGSASRATGSSLSSRTGSQGSATATGDRRDRRSDSPKRDRAQGVRKERGSDVDGSDLSKGGTLSKGGAKGSSSRKKGQSVFTAEALATMAKSTLEDAIEYDQKATNVHSSFERRLGAALHKKGMGIKELLYDWDPEKTGVIKKVPFRQHVRKELGLVADNKEIDHFFDSVDEDRGGTLEVKELKGALRTLSKAAGAADAEAAALRAKAQSCRALAEQMQQASEATAATEKEEKELAQMKLDHGMGGKVDIQLGAIITKRNLKIGDLVSKWVKRKDVSRSDFKKHVLELGVVPYPAGGTREEGEARSAHPVDALFDTLDKDGGGSLDIDELKGLLNFLVEKAKKAATDEAVLERSSGQLRRACLEQQQTIAAAHNVRIKEKKEEEVLAEKLAEQKAAQEATEEEARREQEETTAQRRAARLLEFEIKVKKRRHLQISTGSEETKIGFLSRLSTPAGRL
jgi:Ca2+-binding EF-hand superfamily protein